MKKLIGKHVFWWIPLLVVIVDQISKYVITMTFPFGKEWTIGFLSIIQIHNTGAGFGILKDQQIFLIGITIIILGALIYFKKELATDNLTTLAWSMIIGGAIGNLIDRVMLGYVIDFIYFHFWPAFNIADSSITIGAAILILHALFPKHLSNKGKSETSKAGNKKEKGTKK